MACILSAMTADISFIGFGEAAAAFASAQGWCGEAIAYDRKVQDPALAAVKRHECVQAGVVCVDTVSDAVNAVPLILSLVTADQALEAARSVAASLKPGALYCDGNSVAPQTKQAAAALIEAAGGHYVDMAIMSPVCPAQLSVPLLLSGANAGAALEALSALGFTNIRVVGEAVGRASTIKMLRSVMYKGVEALTAECLMACEKAGVTDDVMASFGNDWSSGADYRLDRMLVHGLRRAAEMEEVALTLEGLGVAPFMTLGTIERQRRIGALDIRPVPETIDAKLKRLVQ